MRACLYLALVTSITARHVSNNLEPRKNYSNGPWQTVPTIQPKPDNTYNDGQSKLNTEPPVVPDAVDPMFAAHPIDIPFGRLHNGSLKYFPKGQLNTPDGITDQWAPSTNDFANQSACGIPDNAFFISKVAIHPYFLNFSPDNLGLSRYCMQDVCISFITEQWSQDMILKVTDICCTDVSDPSCCHTPNDIKIDRTKAQILEGFSGQNISTTPELSGDEFPGGTFWFLTKCWDDALVQPAYADNWWSTPRLPNNEQVPVDAQQAANNAQTYPAKGWKPYPLSGYNQNRVPWVIDDWQPSDPDPEWQPLAGGKGWGRPVTASTANISSSTALAGGGGRANGTGVKVDEGGKGSCGVDRI